MEIIVTWHDVWQKYFCKFSHHCSLIICTLVSDQLVSLMSTTFSRVYLMNFYGGSFRCRGPFISLTEWVWLYINLVITPIKYMLWLLLYQFILSGSYSLVTKKKPGLLENPENFNHKSQFVCLGRFNLWEACMSPQGGAMEIHGSKK